MKRRLWLWTKSWLLRRPLYGQYEQLLHELTVEDIPRYRNFLRMNPEMFHELLARAGHKICIVGKVHTSMPVSVALLVASRYALPGYGDRRVWVRDPGLPDHCVRL